MAKRIYIVDDEPDMLKIATDLLESDGYIVSSAEHPKPALKELDKNPPDLLLLDVRLPEMDGYQVLRELKSNTKTKKIPVIMISVKSDETDIVVGLELGADDYITKPFRKRELLARVKTALRRLQGETGIQVIEIGALRLDYSRYTLHVKGKPISLTPKEFDLLGFLMQCEGRAITRPTISEKVWGIEFTGSTRTIDVHIDQIRRKLGKFGSYIKGLKGIGYRFEVD